MEKGILLAYDFLCSEGGIETLMLDFISAKNSLVWKIVTRKSKERNEDEEQFDIVRIPIRPQLRFIDRFWLRFIRPSFTLPELIEFQTRKKLKELCRSEKPAILFADQSATALAVKNGAIEFGIPWGLWVYGKELIKKTAQLQELLSSADIVLACSNFTRNLAIDRGATPGKTHVVYPCVDTDRFHPTVNGDSIKEKFNLQKCTVLLTVSHLVPRKGHELVLRAIAMIRKDRGSIKYLIVGRGPEMPRLKLIAQELGILDLTIFCGYVQDSELPNYYAAADIIVMPSNVQGDVEGFGITFLEAAASGKPAIGSFTGGIPEAIENNNTGILVNPDDLKGLSDSILRLVKDVELQKTMGSNARRRVMKKFSKEVFNRRLEECFNKLGSL